MTVIAPERSIPQPWSKAVPTVQSSRPDIVAVKSVSNSRPSSRSRITKPRQDVPFTDFTSRDATLSFIRRTLITESSTTDGARATPKPVEGALPPLTSSNDVDIQLYAIVAVIVKDFVQTWYSKITQDHSFIEEITQIIAHCSRALEQRIRQIDMAELLLDEVPALVVDHIKAYRAATSSAAKMVYDVPVGVIYHSFNPHPALTPFPTSDSTDDVHTQSQNEAAYRQLLINGALASLLPTEDLQNTPLRALVVDIIADLIIGQAVAERVCEGWFLHRAITKAINVSREEIKPKTSGQRLRLQTETKLEKFGLMNPEQDIKAPPRAASQSSMVLWFWRILQWAYLAITVGRSVMQGIFFARQLPERSRLSLLPKGMVKLSASSINTHEHDQSPRAVFSYRILNMVSTTIRLRERMPWLVAMVMFCQHMLLTGYGRLCATNSVLDRFFHHQLNDHVFTPNLLVLILVGVRTAVFPNNSLAPSAPPPPSLEECAQIRQEAAHAISSMIPFVAARKFFHSDDEEHTIESIKADILDVFGDKYMNKHLLYRVLEVILVRIVPELQNSSPRELLEDRGIIWGGIEEDNDIITLSTALQAD